MASNAINRKTIRARWETHFVADVVGGGHAHAFYSYDRRDFAGQSPVLLMVSLGSRRIPFGVGNSEKFDNAFRFALFGFVREADPDAGYTAAEVEDAIDDLDKAVSDCVMDHRIDAGYWLDAYLEETPSSVVPVVQNNIGYKMEARVLIVEVVDG